MQIMNSPAHLAAMERFVEHNNEVRPAYDSLNLPFTFQEVLEFLLGAETFRALPDGGEPGLPTKGAVAGLLTALIIVLEEQRQIDKQRLRVVRNTERKKR